MNYYDILGVDKNASQADIKSAFRKKAIEHHPDKGGDENKFKQVSEAYEVLSDEEKKREYDMYGSGGNPFGGGGGNRYQGHGFNMDDLFSQFGSFFGDRNQRNKRTRRGGDLRVQLTVSLEDVMLGTTKKLKYNRQKPCDPCKGKGGSELKNCLACGGSGLKSVTQQTPFGIISQTVHCNNCSGSGQVVSNPCKSCKGDGTKLSEDILDIAIPKGVAGGMAINMSGYGNHIRGGSPGDLQVHIEEIAHPRIRREGHDLHIDEWISIPDAVLGTSKTVESITDKVNFTVNPGCESGTTFRFVGKGAPILASDGSNHGAGSLYVKVNVKIPKKISAEEQKIYESLRKID